MGAPSDLSPPGGMMVSRPGPHTTRPGHDQSEGAPVTIPEATPVTAAERLARAARYWQQWQDTAALGFPVEDVLDQMSADALEVLDELARLKAARIDEDERALAFRYGDRVQVVNRKSYRAGSIGTVELVNFDADWPFVDVDFGNGDTCRYAPSALALSPEETERRQRAAENGDA